MEETWKRPKNMSIENFGSEGAREMALGGNESWRGELQNARIKSKNCWLIPKSAANLY
jgi:hypothetical protein